MNPKVRSHESQPQRPNKRARRSFVACRRCHSQKIKCSGGVPCSACASANKGSTCDYPFRERKVTISEHYLKQLETDSRALRNQSLGDRTSVETPQEDDEELPAEPIPVAPDVELSNPLFDARRALPAGHSTTKPPFFGEASCDAFGDRLLQCVNRRDDTSLPATPKYARNSAFERMASANYTLPDRIQAKLLLQVALRFIGNGQHLFLKKSYLEELESVYQQNNDDLSPVWLCKYFALLALGEMYSNRKRQVPDQVPGQTHFMSAINLLQDLYEEATIMQVEVYLLLACYSNALGRIRSAYTYSGIAMRIALSLGMHRASTTSSSHMTAVEREAHRCIWWSLYFFDRLTCSKLGQPVNVNDEYIDAELPSMTGLSPQEQEEFSHPSHLCASVGLARISGLILSDIYCLPGRNKGTFVQRVHRILSNLRSWDDELQDNLRFSWDASNRHVASLHLCYNQCIIHTTRPILLYLFRTQFHLGARIPRGQRPPFSPMTIALADSCVTAARTSNKILSKLFIDGNIATLGYWDAHYLYSSTLILMMSAVMDPNISTSDAVQTALTLLRSMRDDGNIPADDYCSRLALIQKSMSELREEMNKDNNPDSVGPNDAPDLGEPDSAGEAGQTESSVEVPPSAPNGNNLGTFEGFRIDDFNALANPYINNFLAEKSFTWPTSSFPDGSTLQLFTSELGDDFIFPELDL